MTNLAPPTPEQKILRRVVAVAGFDGWSVIGIAGAGMLLTLALGDLSGLLVGLFIAAAGVMELHGRRLLQRRDPAGMRWLVRAQMFLLAVILVYCVSRLLSFDAESVMGNLTPDMAAALQEAGLEQADILPLVHTMFLAVYGGVALASVLFQGGMALYYRSRTARVTTALRQPLVAPQTPLATG